MGEMARDLILQGGRRGMGRAGEKIQEPGVEEFLPRALSSLASTTVNQEHGLSQRTLGQIWLVKMGKGGHHDLSSSSVTREQQEAREGQVILETGAE